MYIRKWRCPVDPESEHIPKDDLEDNLARRQRIRKDNQGTAQLRLENRAKEMTRQWNRKRQPMVIEPKSWVYNRNYRLEGPYQVQFVSQHPNGCLKCVWVHDKNGNLLPIARRHVRQHVEAREETGQYPATTRESFYLV